MYVYTHVCKKHMIYQERLGRLRAQAPRGAQTIHTTQADTHTHTHTCMLTALTHVPVPKHTCKHTHVQSTQVTTHTSRSHLHTGTHTYMFTYIHTAMAIPWVPGQSSLDDSFTRGTCFDNYRMYAYRIYICTHAQHKQTQACIPSHRSHVSTLATLTQTCGHISNKRVQTHAHIQATRTLLQALATWLYVYRHVVIYSISIPTHMHTHTCMF